MTKGRWDSVYVIGNLERQTEKAILVDFTYSGSKTWLPKSQVRAVKNDGDATILVEMPYWLYRKNGGHLLIGPCSEEMPATFQQMLDDSQAVHVV